MTNQEKRDFLTSIGYTGDYADRAMERDTKYDTITDQGDAFVFLTDEDDFTYEPAEPDWPQVTSVCITAKKHFQKHNCLDDHSMFKTSLVFDKLVKDCTLQRAEEQESVYASTKYNVDELKAKLKEAGLIPVTWGQKI